jgi:tetratricopeptide (TPR) repeat protein
LPAILALGLGLRVLYLLQARGHLYFNAFSDSLYYHSWALRLIEGQPGPQVFYLGPLYPYLLAFFYTIFGPYVELFLWFQVLLGTAGCALLFFLGRRVGGPGVGLLAALMGAVYRVEIFYEGLLLMAVTLIVLHLLLLLTVYWALEGRKASRWLLAGLLLGLAAAGRSNILLFFPFLIAAVWWSWRPREVLRGLRLRAAAVLILGLLAVVVPISLHNVISGADRVPITSNLGMNFFIGNHDRATGYYVKPKGLDLAEDIYGIKIANLRARRPLKPSEVSRFWLQQGLEFVRARPAAAARLIWRKLLFLGNAYEIPQVEDIGFLGRFVPLLRWPLLSFSVLGPLGLLGILISLGRWRRLFPLLGFLLAYVAGTVPFFVISRLRLQICPVLMIFAAAALVWIGSRIRSRSYRPLTVALVVLVALAVLVNWPLASLDRVRHRAQSHRFYALHLRTQGRLPEAAREYRRAIEIDPTLADSYVDLAALRMEQGDPEAALSLYREALAADPEVSGVHLNLGTMFARQGLWKRAIEQFRKEIRNSPYSFIAHERLFRAEEASRGAPPDSAAGQTLPEGGIEGS